MRNTRKLRISDKCYLLFLVIFKLTCVLFANFVNPEKWQLYPYLCVKIRIHMVLWFTGENMVESFDIGQITFSIFVYLLKDL